MTGTPFSIDEMSSLIFVQQASAMSFADGPVPENNQIKK